MAAQHFMTTKLASGGPRAIECEFRLWMFTIP
jgi:hypothetical protein